MSNHIPRETWRLLITAPTDGATNMAIDEAILYALAEGHGQPTLRFYQWAPPCLSLGYNQPFSEVDEAVCQSLGYTWVRRPTGGRAILHTDELTYSYITSANDIRVKGGIVDSYRALSQGILRGLQYLGADAVQAKRDMPKNPEQGTACFDTPSSYEITLNGKKLVGSAQVRRKGMVLQHGTLPLRGDITRIFKVLVMTESERTILGQKLLARATTLAAELGREVSFDETAQALAQGFAKALNLKLDPGPLTDREKMLTDQLRARQYAHDIWNKRL
jgi:lipoate-protein ligase A